MLLKSIAAKIFKKARLSSVRQSKIHSTSKVESGSLVVCSSFDRYSFCGYDCDIYHAKIGSFTSIANHVVIGGARHPMEWVGMSPVFYSGRDSVRRKFSKHILSAPSITSIGHDVWIGNSAIILSGVEIGDGAVIGAGSVVTKDVPPYGIAAGNPARLIRYRFDDAVIAGLQATKWWQLDDDTLQKLGSYVQEPNLFIAKHRELKVDCADCLKIKS